jgi:YHS domain-containing protein
MKKRLLLLLVLLTLLPLTVRSLPAEAAPPVNTGLLSSVAVDGYDPVAYFTDGAPRQGSSAFSTTWHGATWYFTSAAHRDQFQAAPERYAPQYGGYCAWAMADGRKADIDPTAWRIVEGRLYLNYDASVQKKWEADIPGHIQRANANYARLSAD